MFFILTALILAYLLGSISSAIIICRIKGLPDPRSQGSENAGATNVLRQSDKQTAAFVLIADLLKGLLAVGIARLGGTPDFWLGLVILAAVLGHIFPVYFQFKGGKGVATALGGLIGLNLPIAIICTLIWLLVAKLYHYSSLAALCAIASTPILALFFTPAAFVPLVLLAGLLFWTHRENIERLRAGTESKINQ